MVRLLRIDGSDAFECAPKTMESQGFRELQHLENWVVDNPEVIDPTMMVITTQFGSWVAENDKAQERPDIIGISSTGDLVVIELKKVLDKNVHLQALTYGALCSSFDLELLAGEHAKWFNRKASADQQITVQDARDKLINHLDADGENAADASTTFALPRLVLVAPGFPPQVLTTVQWLSEVAPDLSIECHQFDLFSVEDQKGSPSYAPNIVASFNRVFPAEDLDQYRLRAQSPRVAIAKEQKAERKKNSVIRILEKGLIENGAALDFNPGGNVKQPSVEVLNAWLDEDPVRRNFYWDSSSSKPFVWGIEPEARWSASSLKNRLFEEAGADQGNFAATLAWFYRGENLAVVADREVEE